MYQCYNNVDYYIIIPYQYCNILPSKCLLRHTQYFFTISMSHICIVFYFFFAFLLFYFYTQICRNLIMLYIFYFVDIFFVYFLFSHWYFIIFIIIAKFAVTWLKSLMMQQWPIHSFQYRLFLFVILLQFISCVPLSKNTI